MLILWQMFIARLRHRLTRCSRQPGCHQGAVAPPTGAGLLVADHHRDFAPGQRLYGFYRAVWVELVEKSPIAAAIFLDLERVEAWAGSEPAIHSVARRRAVPDAAADAN